MITNWRDFVSFAGLGLSTGLVIGFLCICVNGVFVGIRRSFVQALNLS